MKEKLFTIIGFLGVIVTFLVSVTTYSSSDYLYRAPFVLIGVLLSIIIAVLGEILFCLKQYFRHINK